MDRVNTVHTEFPPEKLAPLPLSSLSYDSNDTSAEIQYRPPPPPQHHTINSINSPTSASSATSNWTINGGRNNQLYNDDPNIKVQVPLDFDFSSLSLDSPPRNEFAAVPLRFAEGESTEPVERVGYVDDTRFSGSDYGSKSGRRTSTDSVKSSYSPGVVVLPNQHQDIARSPSPRRVTSISSISSITKGYPSPTPSAMTYPNSPGNQAPVAGARESIYGSPYAQHQQLYPHSNAPPPGQEYYRPSGQQHPPPGRPIFRPGPSGSPLQQHQGQQHQGQQYPQQYPKHDPRYQQPRPPLRPHHQYPASYPNGVQNNGYESSDYGQEYYHDPYYQNHHPGGGGGYDSGPGYRPPGHGSYGPPGQQYRPRPMGANLQPSPSIRGPAPGRGGPRPMMMGPGPGPGPGPGGPYGPRPPLQRPPPPNQHPIQGQGAQPPRRRPLSLEVLDEMRQHAKNSNDPAAQLDYAKALVSAASSFGNEDPDPKRQRKNKEALLMEGLKIIKRLATTGMGMGKPAYPEAQFYLANCYGNGSLGLQIDHDKAFGLYVQASKQHHPAATYRTGVCYELGAGTKRDYNRAVNYYRKAAAMNDTPAMHKMGVTLLKGLLGQQSNPREAITWLKRAAANADEENPYALHDLALCFEKAGIPTVIPDESYARELFTQAAGYGYAPSQYKLGHCYEYGTLTCPVDPRRSIAWYTRAAEQGDPESELGLSGWYLTGEDGVLKQSDTEAYLWARKAADKGLARAEYAVGYYTEVGIGVKQDLEEARKWYQRAAAQGNSRAKRRLTDMKKLGAMRRMRHDRAQGGGHEDDNCKVM